MTLESTGTVIDTIDVRISYKIIELSQPVYTPVPTKLSRN